MKRTFRILGVMVCMLLMTFGFTACSGNDEDNEKDSSIVGTWCVETVHYLGTDSECTEYAEVSFSKDGVVTGYWKDTYKTGEVEIETDKGRYEVIKNVLRIWWESDVEDNASGPSTWTFTINGDKMTTSENGGTVWTRK